MGVRKVSHDHSVGSVTNRGKPRVHASTEEWGLVKSWRKEGGSVRKCHKDHEMLVRNNK